MKHETYAHPEEREIGADGSSRRNDPRYPVAVQAFVAIPSLNSRAYQVREISRGGMFLAFKEPTSTRLELERNTVEPGTRVEIAFAFSVADVRHRCSVNAQITRITRQGIGVQFTTHKRPQLAPPRALFAQHDAHEKPRKVPDHAGQGSRGKHSSATPPDTGAWQDWKPLE